METAAYFLRVLVLGAVATFLGGVSPAQSPSTSNRVEEGPFGFNCGMSQQAIASLVGTLKSEGVNEYSTSTAPKPYPNVGFYYLTVSPTQGLAKVSAVTNDIETDSDGADLIKQFHAIEADLIKQYGKPTRQDDFLKPGSIWAGQDEWTLSYLKKQRTLASFWVFPNPMGCITSIDLTAEVANLSTGAITIDFELKGFNPTPNNRAQKNAALETSK